MFKNILFVVSSLIVVLTADVLHAQTLPSTLIVSNVSYNAAGAITQINYGNGNVTTYLYNDLNLRLNRIKTVNDSSQTIQDLNYTYDALGNILSIVDNVNTADQTFQYDALNRLTQAVGQQYGTKNYSYNQIGNITSKDGLTYTYDGIAGGPHAVTGLSDGTTFTYDDNGNMFTMQKGADLTEYIYDVENRLLEVKENSQSQATYAYDGDGGRTRKSPTGTTPVTKFIGEMFEEQGTRETSYIFLGSQRIASITNGSILYFHADHLGSANLVTDSTGILKELSEYEPYGKFSKHEKYGDPQEEAWYYFTNQYLDEESELYYYGARYYSPLIGRFITPDTIVQSPGNPQTFNRYSYVGNNPVNRIDPTGHKWSWGNFFKAVAIAIIGTVLTIASAGVLTPLVGVYWAGVAGGALAGATIGGTFAAATGGDIGMGLLTGAIGGAVFAGLAPGLSSLSNGVARGISLGGASGPLTSGVSMASNFTAGFLGGAASGAAVAGAYGGDVGQGALIGGATAGAFSLARSTAQSIRARVTAQSLENNSGGESVGWLGDGVKNGGPRNNPNPKNVFSRNFGFNFGGKQDGPGELGIKLFGKSFVYNYARGSIPDIIVEMWSGPHDFLNSWAYESSGPHIGNIRQLSSIEQTVAAFTNPLNVVIAAPLAITSTLPGSTGSIVYGQREE